jgi:predicted dehydrogenase
MATEDYLSKSVGFKIRKILRYVELYGVCRTYVKVIGQFHMRSSVGFDGNVWTNEKCKITGKQRRRVGIIGCGLFAFGNIAYYLHKENNCFLKGAMDIIPSRARSLVSRYGGEYATNDASVILRDPDIDLVYIASNHASHADYAVEALKNGKNVHVEKPHVVSEGQLKSLNEAMGLRPDLQVFLGFNRPRSMLFRRLQNELKREEGPSMINWFVAGHQIDDDNWYFKTEEGGRILGNLCHWSDLTLQMIQPEYRFPCKIIPTSPRNAKSDFVTALEFADGSLACITFSAKGHTFEGVREVLNVHRGELLAELKDFKTLSINRGYVRKRVTSLFRDHGHRTNIVNSYRSTQQGTDEEGVPGEYVDLTARLFLGIRSAHDEGRPVLLDAEGLKPLLWES